VDLMHVGLSSERVLFTSGKKEVDLSEWTQIYILQSSNSDLLGRARKSQYKGFAVRAADCILSESVKRDANGSLSPTLLEIAQRALLLSRPGYPTLLTLRFASGYVQCYRYSGAWRDSFYFHEGRLLPLRQYPCLETTNHLDLQNTVTMLDLPYLGIPMDYFRAWLEGPRMWLRVDEVFDGMNRQYFVKRKYFDDEVMFIKEPPDVSCQDLWSILQRLVRQRRPMNAFARNLTSKKTLYTNWAVTVTDETCSHYKVCGCRLTVRGISDVTRNMVYHGSNVSVADQFIEIVRLVGVSRSCLWICPRRPPPPQLLIGKSYMNVKHWSEAVLESFLTVEWASADRDVYPHDRRFNSRKAFMNEESAVALLSVNKI